MSIIRTYFIPPGSKRPSHYREAWWDQEAGELVLHHGQLGYIGVTEVEIVNHKNEADSLLDSFAQQNFADGYKDVADIQQERLVISIKYKGVEPTIVEETNAEKFAGQYTALLAWRGLGAVDKWQSLLNDGQYRFEVSTVHRNKAARFASEALKYTDFRMDRMRIERV